MENAYEACLYYELMQAGLLVSKQRPMPVVYRDVKLEAGYRIDLFVENKVVLEIKAVEAFHDLHFAQLLTYLKL